jgi:hypothetical protein
VKNAVAAAETATSAAARGGTAIGLVALIIVLSGALIAFVAATLSPAIAGAAVMALIVFATILAFPLVGLAGFALVGSIFPFSAPGGASITAAEALLVVSWAAVLLNHLLGRTRIEVGSTERIVLVLVVFALIPCILGILLIPEGQLGLVRWTRWALNISTVLLVGAIVRTERHLWIIISATIVGAAVMLMISLAIYIPHRDARAFIPLLEWARYGQMEWVLYSFTSFYERMGSTWIHPNLLGGYLAMIVPVACTMLLLVREPWRSAIIGFALLALVGLFLSISRAAMIGFATSLLWFVRQRVPYSLGVFVCGMLCAAALVATSGRVQDRLSALFATESSRTVESSTAVRLDEYRAFPTAVMRYPMGIGFAVEPSTFVENKPDLRQISNLWLNYTYRISVVGMILFIWVTLRWWREVRPVAGANYGDPLTNMHYGMVGGLLGTLVIGVFDHYFGFQIVIVAFWWMFVGLTLFTGRRLRQASGAAPALRSALPERGRENAEP